MNADSPREGSHGPSALLLFDELCNQFENSWRAGERPVLEHFLLGIPGHLRNDALKELLVLDLAYRRQREEDPSPEDYYNRFSQDRAVVDQAFDEAAKAAAAASSAAAEETRLTTAKPATDAPPDGAAEGCANWQKDLPTSDEAQLHQRAPVRFHDAQQGRRIDKSGNYLLSGELARGGLGRVYLATDPQIGRDVAIKQMRPELRGAPELTLRFQEEAQITGQLEHPNIVPIYDLGWLSDGSPYYAMRLLGERTLKDAIGSYHRLLDNDPTKPMAFNEVLRGFASVCQAVAYAHTRKVLHRDLKPANVMLGDFGEVFVLDWGLAKVLGRDEVPSRDASTIIGGKLKLQGRSSAQLSSAGSVLGTPGYMSPEQADGQIEDLDATSDVYSLGAILYEILVGHGPFLGDTPAEVIERNKKGEVPPPRQFRRAVSPPLEAVCLKATSFARSERYQRATDLAQEILRWQSGEPVLAYREPLHQRAARWARRHRSLCFSAASVLLVLLLAWLGLRWRNANRIEKLRNESLPAILDGQALLSQGKLDSAQLKLSSVHARLSSEPSLKDLQIKAEELLGQVEEQKSVQAARQAERSLLRAFRERREQALFESTYYTGLDLPESLQKRKGIIRDAFALFRLSIDAPELPKLNGRSFSKEETTEIHDGCRTLLLLHVGALLQPLPDFAMDELQRSARQALSLLQRLELERDCPFATKLLRWKCFVILDDEPQRQELERQLAKTRPHGATDWLLAGLEAFDRQDYAQALPRLETALQQKPDSFWSQFFVGLCYVHLGTKQQEDAEKAIAHLSACISRRPSFVWNYLVRGYAYGLAKRWKAADGDFDTAWDLGVKEKYPFYVNRANVRLLQGKSKLVLAEQDLEDAFRHNKDRYQAYLGMADVHLQRQDYPNAAQMLDKAEERNPNVPGLYRRRAVLHRAKGDLNKALEALNQAAKLQVPGSMSWVETHLERGRALQGLKRYAEALRAYNDAIRIDTARLLRGLTLQSLNEHERAKTDFSAFIQGSQLPEEQRKLLAVAHRERGLLRAGARNPDKRGALEDYVRAVELSAPDLEKLSEYDRNRLAFMLTRRAWAFLNDTAEPAKGDFEQILKWRPNSVDALLGRAYVRAILDDVAGAVEDAKAALAARRKDELTPEWAVVVNAANVYAQVHLSARKFKAPDDDVAKYRTRCFDLLKQGLTILEGTPYGAQIIPEVLKDKALDPVRFHPDFPKRKKR